MATQQGKKLCTDVGVAGSSVGPTTSKSPLSIDGSGDYNTTKEGGVFLS